MKFDLLAMPLGVTLAAVAACTSAQMQSAGISAGTAGTVATVTQDLAATGQLFCANKGVLYQAVGVTVTGATAQAVADACAALDGVVGAVPVAGVVGQPAIAAHVPAPVAAAVQASKAP